MTVEFKSGDIGIVTDDSRAAAEGVNFLLSKQNQMFADEARAKGATIISPVELIDRLELGKINVIGITGTNGKTTTAAAIYSILLDLDMGAALQGTRGFFINDERKEEKSLTTPPLLQTISHICEAKESGCDYFVMEVSSHAIEQNRIEEIPFALKVHTNVTSDHLDYHGDIEAYRAVKSSFFSDESKKLINRDENIIKFNIKNTFGYAIENPATYKIMVYTLEGGVSGMIKNFETVVPFETSLHGLFNLYNMTAAMSAVHIVTKRSLEEIADAAESFGGVMGRMEVVSQNPFIVVDFAHTEDGIKQVMDAYKDKDIRVVFGAGGDRDKSKRPKMGVAAAMGAKKIYITSDNPRSEKPEAIIEEIASKIEAKDKIVKIVDRKEAIEKAIDDMQTDEVLLILGKGDETYQIIGDKKIPFNDKEIVNNYLSSH